MCYMNLLLEIILHPWIYKEILLHNCLRVQCTPAVMAELQFKTYVISGN